MEVNYLKILYMYSFAETEEDHAKHNRMTVILAHTRLNDFRLNITTLFHMQSLYTRNVKRDRKITINGESVRI
jgi:hypothetical protein